jgi:hypothetical protein
VTQRFPKMVGIVMGISVLVPGLWAMFAPESFFENLGKFEPYNQHFIQDIGAFQIGLGAVLLLATLRGDLTSLTIALLGTGIGAAAHAVSHVIGRDLGGRPGLDIPMFTTSAVLLLVAGVWQHRADTARA